MTSEMTSLTKPALIRFSRYVMVGLTTNGSIFLIYLVMIWIGLIPIVASALCYMIGVTASYVLNRKWTFESTSTHRKDMIRFAIAYGVGLIATMISMAVLVTPLGPVWAQVVTIGIAAVSIYSTLELLKFGR